MNDGCKVDDVGVAESIRGGEDIAGTKLGFGEERAGLGRGRCSSVLLECGGVAAGLLGG